jgi:hypothetical protein
VPTDQKAGGSNPSERARSQASPLPDTAFLLTDLLTAAINSHQTAPTARAKMTAASASCSLMTWAYTRKVIDGSACPSRAATTYTGHVFAATGHGHAHGTLISDTGEATGWANVCNQTGEDDDHLAVDDSGGEKNRLAQIRGWPAECTCPPLQHQA